MMRDIGMEAKKAALELSNAKPAIKNKALVSAAEKIRENVDIIIEKNCIDLVSAKKNGSTSAIIDRLELTVDRIQSMASGLESIAKLTDPVGKTLDEWQRPNGLLISRVSVPLGVIGVIYESRPNVTADAGALCLKSGNAAILRAGSESFHTSSEIMKCIKAGLQSANLPETAVQLVPTIDRAAVGEMLAMSDYIDVLVPRGGRSLVERVQADAKVPIFAHLEGVCHTYVHKESNPDMACAIVLNAKMRRPGICGATETLLIDKEIINSHLPPIIEALLSAGCEIRGDQPIIDCSDKILPAFEADWSTEYLDAILSIKQVKGLREAINHINHYGTEHTDAIITDDDNVAHEFMSEVKSAIAIHNASTQFADGGEFGMGAEIGISTGRMHARGPVGVDQLTTFKYMVKGSGQIRH
ncbi:MAG: glutamate-5-semialdehyde dehydrogenase [Rhodospirillaceae bacterium]|mgnify:FL=1|nr:glutamate-5-semialdehyde dehydrogenase [Rhodospirillaceae bacterium]OUT79551.1 MAG: glutamate-5-semialdehyde dehydrogenase [Rhodospirillaceae bacterium TMED23]|tara:strand:+ start:1242 stop:2483 length:1242 start_codon:yes stop_codon:yes gene_type:complete